MNRKLLLQQTNWQLHRPISHLRNETQLLPEMPSQAGGDYIVRIGPLKAEG